MFRDNGGNTLDRRHFGVGSTIEDGYRERGKWLVISSQDEEYVGLVNIKTFVVVGKWISVKDPTYLTEAEVRMLVEETGLKLAFIDYDLDSAGLKQ